LDLGKEITLLNVYGPYMDRVDYWDRFFQMDWIHFGLVVVGGDLNFTLGALEFWGHVAQVDYLSGYFIKKMEEVGLLDVEPTKLTPTLRNKRLGEACIAKRLNHFLISKSFLDEVTQIKQWVSSGGILTIIQSYWK
jgi:hypothetical protein